MYEDYGISYILCYPCIELKEEYRSRYIARGNTNDFMDVFIDQWDTRIKMLDNDEYGVHFKLKSGQFLTDIKDEIDTLMNTAGHTQTKRNEEILELEQISDIKLSQGCVHLGGYASPSYGIVKKCAVKIYPKFDSIICLLQSPQLHLIHFQHSVKVAEGAPYNLD